jgi:hypothetical protein
MSGARTHGLTPPVALFLRRSLPLFEDFQPADGRTEAKIE